MKRKHSLFILVLLAILFTGCPYSSYTPLEKNPSMKFPRNYTGLWIYEMDTYRIKRPDEFHFRAENISDSYNKDIYEGFLTKLEKDVFLNSRSITTNMYSFFKLVPIDENTFELRGVSDYITDTFPSQSELKDFFIRYKNLSFFFEKEPLRFKKIATN